MKEVLTQTHIEIKMCQESCISMQIVSMHYIKIFSTSNINAAVSLGNKDIHNLISVNPLNIENPCMHAFVKSEDQDQMPQNVAFHQGLYRLL